MARVLITGAAGFIGSHLAEHLRERGDDVIGSDVRAQPPFLKGIQWIACDLTNGTATMNMLRGARPSAVMHLAACTTLDDMTDTRQYDANVEAAANLLSAIESTGGVDRTICTSTQLVCRIDYQPKSDEDFQATTAYGQSKVETERLWRRRSGGGTTWCIVRPTTVWGPRMNVHYLRFFGMIRRGTYRHVGHADRLKSYSFVGNIVRQYECLLDAPREAIAGKVFYLADYEPLALNAWADMLAAAFGAPRIRTIPLWVASLAARIGDAINGIGFRSFPFNSFRLRNVLTAYSADTRPIERICPTLPFSVKDGVSRTAEWVRSTWSEDAA